MLHLWLLITAGQRLGRSCEALVGPMVLCEPAMRVVLREQLQN